MPDQVQATTEPVRHAHRAGELLRQPRFRLGAVIALAAAAALIAWAVISNGGNSSSSATPATVSPIAPVGLSAEGLTTLAQSVDQPIYWAGPKPGYRYELSRATNGNVYIRYLPPGVKAGDKRAIFLIVATYPYPNALRALKGVANGQGIELPGGGFALPDASYPKSVHLAFPDVNYQAEVYDVSPQVAREVALSGQVRSVR